MVPLWRFHSQQLALTLLCHVLLLLSSIHKCHAIGFNNTPSGTHLGILSEPDILECSPIYGDSLIGDLCRNTLVYIFPGFMPRFLTVTTNKKGSSPTTLQAPKEYKNAEVKPSCQVTVDLAGPPFADGSKNLFSNQLRGLVEAVITACVDKAGWGGFATFGIDRSGIGLYPSERGSFESPLFLTVSVGQPYLPNLEPGNTDPSVPLALKIPLEDYRSRALLQSTKAKATVLINQLEFQASQMVQGGKKTWWDTQDFREIIPTGVSYECKSELGIGESLAGGDCRKASFNFIQQGEATIAHNIPLEFESGQCEFKVVSTRDDVLIPWNALRAAADMLLYTCVEGNDAPGYGGQVVFTGAPGPSTGYQWPDGLVVTMGKVGLVVHGSSTSGGGNGSGSHLVSASPSVNTTLDLMS